MALLSFRRFFFLVFILVMAAVGFTGCKKEKQGQYSETLTMGDYNQMLLQKIALTQSPGYPGENRFEMDVNEDGQADLVIGCHDAGSPGAGSLPSSYLATLHGDIQLLVGDKPDSLFSSLKRDTTITPDTIFCYTRTYQGCRRKNAYDTLTSAGTLVVPEQLNSGSVISRNQTWAGMNYTLGATPWTRPEVTPAGSDTLKILLPDADFSCNRPPIGKDVYYAFRLKEADQFRLGWIRLRMEGKGTVYIEETAIQSAY